MTASELQMNRFERILLRVALVLAALIVAVCVGAVIVFWDLHHTR